MLEPGCVTSGNKTLRNRLPHCLRNQNAAEDEGKELPIFWASLLFKTASLKGSHDACRSSAAARASLSK
jgi:hypothetical protein